MPVGGALMAGRGSRGRGGVLDVSALDGAVARVAHGQGRPVSVASGDVVRERAVAEMQRARLLGAAVRVLEEQGHEHATVAHITHRARVSRRTFYELFANREQCIAAVLRDTTQRIEEQLRDAGLERQPWRERMRGGLWTILCFLQREPELGRVLVVHALRGSGPVLEARAQIVGRLVAAVDAGRRESARGAAPSELTAEGVVGAALAILHSRLVQRSRSPRLTELLGELASTVVLPYLGPAVARRERARPAPAAAPGFAAGVGRAGASEADPLAGLPMRLTYRTARALEGAARHPGANNRQLGDYAGIADQGQVSKLLARLEGLGLLSNQSTGRAKGEPNRWLLTPRGALVARSIATHAGASGGERGSDANGVGGRRAA